jgi:hypothetical protein
MMQFNKETKKVKQSKAEFLKAKTKFNSKLKVEAKKMKADYQSERKTALANLFVQQKDENLAKINSSYQKAMTSLEHKLKETKINVSQFNQAKQQKELRRENLKTKEEKSYQRKTQRYLGLR